MRQFIQHSLNSLAGAGIAFMVCAVITGTLAAIAGLVNAMFF